MSGRTVSTFGTSDVLHVGHFRVLQRDDVLEHVARLGS